MWFLGSIGARCWAETLSGSVSAWGTAWMGKFYSWKKYDVRDKDQDVEYGAKGCITSENNSGHRVSCANQRGCRWIWCIDDLHWNRRNRLSRRKASRKWYDATRRQGLHSQEKNNQWHSQIGTFSCSWLFCSIGSGHESVVSTDWDGMRRIYNWPLGAFPDIYRGVFHCGHGHCGRSSQILSDNDGAGWREVGEKLERDSRQRHVPWYDVGAHLPFHVESYHIVPLFPFGFMFSISFYFFISFFFLKSSSFYLYILYSII